MQVQLGQFFVFYLALFLAVLFAAWLLWIGRRFAYWHRERESIVCPFCEQAFDPGDQMTYVRCPHCHGRFRREDLQETSDADNLSQPGKE